MKKIKQWGGNSVRLKKKKTWLPYLWVSKVVLVGRYRVYFFRALLIPAFLCPSAFVNFG